MCALEAGRDPQWLAEFRISLNHVNTAYSHVGVDATLFSTAI